MLHCLYSSRVLSHLSAHFPSPWAWTFTNFWRFMVPPSQSLEQSDQDVQGLNTQSASQAWSLHALLCDFSPHGFPPFLGATLTSRSRCITPPPHAAVHLLQPDHASSSQST